MTISRLVIATGGTCGHIFPALAVAEEAKRRNPACEVLFLGGNGPEARLAPEAGLHFASLPARGVLGRGLKGKLGSVWVIGAVMKAMGHLKRFKPEAAVGFGGYAGFCPILAAHLKGIPTAVHEQNSVPGATNRILGRFVRKAFLSFPDEKNVFPPEKAELTGNPVRRDIFQAVRPESPGKRLLVFGGGQGAVAINDAVIEALPQLKELGVEILHQAGKADEGRVRVAYREAGWHDSCVHGFMDDMAGAYAWADMALCRAGASTVFEVAAAGLPAVFVPFPHATHDHQAMNAKAMEKAGAAQVLDQAGLDGRQVAITVRTLLGNTDKLTRMSEAARNFARPDAASAIMDGVEEMAA